MILPPTYFAIDPGTNQSAIVIWNGTAILTAEILPNDELLNLLRHGHYEAMVVDEGSEVKYAIERFQAMGMAVGKEVFDTCIFVGRLQEIACQRKIPCELIYRNHVRMHHCQSPRAKDGNVRRALIDKYGEPGKKKAPGLTYKLKSHLWQAFAIATMVTEQKKEGQRCVTPLAQEQP